MRRPGAMVLVTFVVGCGGTTGHDQGPGPSVTASDATTDAFVGSVVDASVEAGADDDSATFDVDIPRSDASRLPDVVSVPEGGGASDAGTVQETCSVDGGQVCDGHDGGVCTPTECLFYRFSKECYEALINNGCLDDEQGDVNNECSDFPPGQTMDPTGIPRSQRCVDVIRCTLAQASAQPTLSFGYCGAQPTSTSCSLPTGQSGPCVSAEQLGLESIAPPTALSRYVSTSYGGGMANRIFNCAIVNLANDMRLQTCLTARDAGP